MQNSMLILLSGALAYALTGPQAGHSAPVLDDALERSTIGTRSGGRFVVGGWQVTGKNDTIYWHVPTITRGAAATLAAPRAASSCASPWGSSAAA